MGANANDNGLFEDYIATLFILTSVILYVPIMTLLLLRKRTQPIRHRSPYLMFISLLSSFTLTICLSSVLFLHIKENNVKSPTCLFYIYNTNILHFMLILPYVFRAFRLLNVFNFQYFNSNFHKSKLRESFYLKILIGIFVFLTLSFLIILSTDTLHYIFPVEIDVCMLKEKETLLAFKLLWILIHVVECILVLTCVIRLQNVKDEFNISDELWTVGIVWLGFELVFIINGTFLNLLDRNVIIILDTIRNYLIVLVSGLLPLIKSFKSLNLPICTTKECAANFNLLLITEKTYDCFFNYLKAYMPEGAKFLSFWTELNVFKHSRNSSNANNILSTDIYEKYLRENSDMNIDFPPHLVEAVHRSYKTQYKNAYCDGFDALGDFVYNTLKDYYYPSFKMSKEYKQLEKDLEKDEIVYSRLVASSMISSLEIE